MSGSLRILIVDDDEVDRLAVRLLLRQAAVEAEVEDCLDAPSALQAVAAGRADCVLLDHDLAGTDGVSVLRDLRANGCSVPIVSLTGQRDEELAVELMKAGAVDYLNKGTLTAERLERSLRYALALHRSEEDRRLLVEREQAARVQAQAASRAKDEFLATLSHELRTPLNAILGWSSLLASGHLDTSTSRKAIETIERNSRLQAQLIEDLLDISRIITGRLRLELRRVRVRSVLEAAADAVRPAADAKRIALRIDLSQPDDELLCDPVRMQQVVWNLLSNAIKFTPHDGEVRVLAAREDRSIVLAVSDTGIGISPAFLPFAFDRFRQQDAATTRIHGGLGLGLAIVRHLVELHGGCVQAQSEGEGLGATFSVTVPVAPEESISPAETEDDLDLPSLEGVRVLVVGHDGNEVDARALVAAILEGCGALVTLVGSPEDALGAIALERPDVILSDMAVPGEDGYAFIKHVRALEPTGLPIPAAALIPRATAGDRARALLAGYHAHLPKPVEPSELAAVVATLAARTPSAEPKP
jgi:signal transduction histidine kinase